MPHTYTNLLVHVVFSTKERRKSISPGQQGDLWAYIGGVARTNGFKALAVGGMNDHCHALLSIPARYSLAKCVQLIKAGSSKWMREKHSRLFAWQECYGEFTVGISQVPATVEYIRNQAAHHRQRDYRAEFLSFLKKNRIEFDLERIDA
jgi:putative transposase